MLEHTANKSLYYEWNKLSIISAAKIKLAEIRTQFGSIISVQISKDREIFSIDIDDGIEFRIHEPPISFRCPKCNQPKLRTFEARLVTLNEVIIEGIGKNCLFEKILGLEIDTSLATNTFERKAKEDVFRFEHQRLYKNATSPEDYLKNLGFYLVLTGVKTGHPPLLQDVQIKLNKILDGNFIESNIDLQILNQAESQARERHENISRLREQEIQTQERRELLDWKEYLQQRQITLAGVDWSSTSLASYFPAGSGPMAERIERYIKLRKRLDIDDLNGLKNAIYSYNKAIESEYGENKEKENRKIEVSLCKFGNNELVSIFCKEFNNLGRSDARQRLVSMSSPAVWLRQNFSDTVKTLESNTNYELTGEVVKTAIDLLTKNPK